VERINFESSRSRFEQQEEQQQTVVENSAAVIHRMEKKQIGT
jgi:hypothetical protein